MARNHAEKKNKILQSFNYWSWSWSVTEFLMRNVARSHQWKSSTNLFTLCFVSIDSFLVTSIVTSWVFILNSQNVRPIIFSATSIYSNDMQKKNIQTCWKNYWQWCRVFNWYNRAVNFIWKNINVAIKRKKCGRPNNQNDLQLKVVALKKSKLSFERLEHWRRA